jgi:SAM-dependent methyltransferase
MTKWPAFYQYEGKLATEPIRAFLSNIGSRYSGALLDVGCGKMPYRSYFPNIGRYSGIDKGIPDSIPANSEFVAGDILSLPFKDEEFEVVLLTQVIEHVPEPLLLLREIHRVLRRNGALILTAPQMGRLHGEPNDFYRFTKYGLSYLLDKQGFAIKHIDTHGGIWRALGSHLNFYFATLAGKGYFSQFLVRNFIIRPLNCTARKLDRMFFWNLDTLGYNIIGTRK